MSNPPVEADRSLPLQSKTQFAAAAGERADLEERLAEANRERDRAREALDRKAELLAYMSHELRTPMNGILGMTHLTLQTELSEKQRECLEVVSTSAHDLLTLINDILDLSKMDAGQLTLESIPFDLRDTIDRGVRSLAPLFEDKGLHVEIAVRDEVPLVLVGDPGRLRQLLLNLLSNAVKFSAGGRVRLVVETQSAEVGNVRLHFQVSDEGVGIPPDRLRSIFEPYVQAKANTTRRHGGTGLGLAICRDLVGLMQGEIWAESIEGEGSTFHFTACFGLAPDPQGESLAAIDQLADLAVYVLSAEGPACAMAQQMLPAGIRASMFDRIEPALCAMSERRPDIVVVDRDHHKLEDVALFDPDIRTIVVSSAGQRGDAARCRKLGVAAYMTRPLGPLDLRDAVRAVVARRDDTLITRHWLRERRPRPRVLAADDSSANRRVLTRMLESHDCVVVTVRDGEEAVEAFDAELFDLILMDLEMPNMNGIEATRALRDSGVQVPIIALTGHLSPERIERCLAAGMTGHLGKPFKLSELVDAIESVVKSRLAF